MKSWVDGLAFKKRFKMTHHHAAAASRVQEIVKMANMIKAMSPSEREAHLEDLSRGTDVNVPKPLVDALIKMSDKDIGDLEEAAIELSGADENNIPADAVSTIHRKFKELPTVARKALIEELPQEDPAAVVALRLYRRLRREPCEELPRFV